MLGGRKNQKVIRLSDQAWREIAWRLGLGKRELEVLQGVVADQHDGEIAAALGLSRHTIRTYARRLRAKLGGNSRVQLVERVFTEYLGLVGELGRPTPS